jgi:hypothetical protein
MAFQSAHRQIGAFISPPLLQIPILQTIFEISPYSAPDRNFLTICEDFPNSYVNIWISDPFLLNDPLFIP